MRARARQQKRRWLVAFGNWTYYPVARTSGNAARQAFRSAILTGYITKQPKSNEDGGWDGVSIEAQALVS